MVKGRDFSKKKEASPSAMDCNMVGKEYGPPVGIGKGWNGNPYTSLGINMVGYKGPAEY